MTPENMEDIKEQEANEAGLWEIQDETVEVADTADDALSHSGYRVPAGGGDSIHHLSGMYQNWFLDYASYVILERAVPHVNDGLKPVQRRILHSMKRLDDGRYNKVANIIGHTMQFHPHG
ncbi:MAG: DNA gyrase/topoisomerase IV subunit A, partial [Tannerella sp.]|nr:DNA gyrase/topoisomerase IV subunit A [Tannerella sp.]